MQQNLQSTARWHIIYFDRVAEDWCQIPIAFDSKAGADAFLKSPGSWPKNTDARVLTRAIRDSAIQILVG